MLQSHSHEKNKIRQAINFESKRVQVKNWENLSNVGAIMNFCYEIEKVPFTIVNSVQDALNGEEVDWRLVFLQQFHFGLKKIKMGLQEYARVIINTRIGIHMLSFYQTREFWLLLSLTKFMYSFFRQRNIYSHFSLYLYYKVWKKEELQSMFHEI